MPEYIFVNRYYYPDTSATAQLLADLCRHLAENGRSVTVIASRQTYTDPRADLSLESRIDGVRIVRCRGTRFGRAGLAGRLLDYLAFYTGAFLSVLALARPGDVVVAKTDPPMLGVVLELAVRLRRARLVNWMQDVFPEIAEVLAGRNLGPLRWLRDRNCRHADYNVAIGDAMHDYLRDGRGVPAARLAVIHNWAPTGLQPVSRDTNPLRATWGLGDRFVVGYAGNLGRAHEARTLLECAVRLRDERQYLFLVVGAGEAASWLRERSHALGLVNIEFRPYQPRERLSESLSAPDMHLVSLQPRAEGFMVPSKIYGIAAVGRPAVFVGAPDGEVARILARDGFGVTVVPGDAAGLADIVRRWDAEAGLHARLCERALAASRRRYDHRRAWRQWSDLLGHIAGPLA